MLTLFPTPAQESDFLQLHYVNQQTVAQKRQHYAGRFKSDLIERTYHRMLHQAEQQLEEFLPPAAADMVVIKATTAAQS